MQYSFADHRTNPEKVTENGEEEDSPYFHPALKFTKLCYFHLRGTCARGSSCSFAHDTKFLKEKPDLQRTILCRAFSNGYCYAGESCKFAHGLGELGQKNGRLLEDTYYVKGWKPKVNDQTKQAVETEVQEPQRQTEICKRFLKGKCKQKACKFLHVLPGSNETQDVLDQHFQNIEVQSQVQSKEEGQSISSDSGMVGQPCGDDAAAGRSTCSTGAGDVVFSESRAYAKFAEALAARPHMDAIEIIEKNTFLHIGPPPLAPAPAIRRSCSVPAFIA
eukprot:TRINITY_DN2565_c3_g1_i1.p1 TRINITY_DN2565_c3_g1~~TRINITY_DN2565_c3_g1_i1.p1  ORF type:complete len:276 (+),score=57.21 TRINITY_DN2565_c3_g1_i1:92-919(+)